VGSLLDAPILSLDDYYRDLAHLPFVERACTNFDEPRSIEHELGSQHLALLAEGGDLADPPRFTKLLATRLAKTL